MATRLSVHRRRRLSLRISCHSHWFSAAAQLSSARVARAGRTSLGHASLCAPAPLSVHLMPRVFLCTGASGASLCASHVTRTGSPLPHSSAARSARWPHLSRPRLSLCISGASLCASHVTRTGSPLAAQLSSAERKNDFFRHHGGSRGVWHPPFATVWYGPKSAVKPCGSPPKKRTTGVRFCDFLCTGDSAPALVKAAKRSESPILDSPVANAGANIFFRGHHPVEPLIHPVNLGLRLVLGLSHTAFSRTPASKSPTRSRAEQKVSLTEVVLFPANQ